MHSWFLYIFIRLLVKLNIFSQYIRSVISSYFINNITRPFDFQRLTSVFIGAKVFSNYSAICKKEIKIIEIRDLKNRQIDNSILILNNNDFTDESCYLSVSEMKKSASNLCIIIWDFDNHHSLVNSLRLLSLSNVYFAAHQHNFEFLRRASSSYYGVLPPAVIQWSKDFLLNSTSSLLSVSRSNELFGPHVYYQNFSNRNKIIELVSKKFPRVGFTNLTYHNRSHEDRFAEWSHFKTHFISPVDHDLPIRLFDALVTGGIPLVPIKMKSLLHTLSLDRFVVFYDECDLTLLQLKVDQAIIKFEQDGTDGMFERINYVLDRHHIDSRIKFLIDFRQ